MSQMEVAVITPERKGELAAALGEVFEQNDEVELVSLCTTDGFDISTVAAQRVTAEPDKLAAIASTLCSLSSVCAKQVVDSVFNITSVETASGNILFLSTQLESGECVLTVATTHKMPLANARFLAKRLATAIEQL